MNSKVSAHGLALRKRRERCVSDNDLSPCGCRHGEAAGVIFRRIEENRAVHLLVRDFDPAAGDADLSPLVGSAVEVLR